MQEANNYILDNVNSLVKECIAGNRSMQNQLYHFYAGRMMVVCMRYTKNRQDAEEILQEGFMKVFTCLRQYKFTGSLEGWIKRIMINCALQKLRIKTSLYPVLDIDYINESYDDRNLIIADMNAKEMIIIIQKLPLMCRLVFNLYVFEGMKHREIAEALGISEGTSKSNLFDARAILQRQLKVYAPFVKSKP